MEVIEGFPATSMDDYQLNITTFIRHAARDFPKREIASRTPEGIFRYNYGEAHKRMQRLANALGTLEIEPGDRIGISGINDHRFYEAYFGIPGTGATMLQLNPRLHPDELSYVINHSGAKMVFADEILLPIFENVAPKAKSIEGYVVMTDRDLEEIETELEPIYSYEDLLEEEKPEYDWPIIDERSACNACYTTGTTGKPKGVYYSHRDLYIHTISVAAEGGLAYEDVFCQITPMFHGQGWGISYTATYMGEKIVLPGLYRVEDPAPLVELLDDEEVTVTCGAPAIFMPMLHYIRELPEGERPDYSGMKMFSGASEPPLDMIKGYKELTGAEVIHAYGATETTPMVTVNKLKLHLDEELSEEEKWDLKRKQGIPASGLDLKIIDEEEEELPHDGESAGEIVVRSPWITGSYYDDPRTEESFTGDGYWKSGDAGTIDEEGYLKLTDRMKDLIKSGGEWISSVDLENAIMAHPDVLDAAVVAAPHPKWEERPLALVVLKEEAKEEVSKDDIVDFIRPKFAKWQLPDDILFVDEIPKTSVGKNDKKKIREKWVR